MKKNQSSLLLYFVLSTKIPQRSKEYVNSNSFHLCFLSHKTKCKTLLLNHVTEKRKQESLGNEDTNPGDGKHPNCPRAEFCWVRPLGAAGSVLIRSILHPARLEPAEVPKSALSDQKQTEIGLSHLGKLPR